MLIGPADLKSNSNNNNKYIWTGQERREVCAEESRAGKGACCVEPRGVQALGRPAWYGSWLLQAV